MSDQQLHAQAPPEPAVERPTTFGELDVVTEESPGALLVASIVCALFMLIALGIMLLEIWKGRGLAGEPQEVEVIDISLGVSEEGAEAPRLDGQAAVVSQVREESRLQVERPEQVQVERPTGTVASSPTVDTSNAREIQRQAQAAQLASRQGISELEREIREAKMSGAGLGGIFKIPDDVKSVVYVLDCSGSMSGAPLQSVKAELLGALKGMKPDVKFFIFFFSDTEIPLSIPGVRGDQLVTATRENVKNAEDWIRVTDQGGGTQPVSAMQRAIDLKPELIFLLSDGQFDSSESQTIIDYNSRKRKGGRINAVGVAEQIFDTLKLIADKTGGVYYRARQAQSGLGTIP